MYWKISFQPKDVTERSFLRELEGGCQVPIGVNSGFKMMRLPRGMVASIDGKRLLKMNQ